MNKVLKVIIYIIVLSLCLVGGWFLGSKLADSGDSVNTSTDTSSTNVDTNSSTNTGEENKKNDNIAYQGWISYILNSDIKSINYYQPILDENDPNFKDGQPGFYAVELSKNDLTDIFNSMNNSTIDLVTGIGGPVSYLEIGYVKDGVNKSVTISEIGSIFSNDDEYNNILKNEVKSIYDSMSDEEKKIYGENPAGNMIKNWDTSNLTKYFSKDKAKVVYNNN